MTKICADCKHCTIVSMGSEAYCEKSTETTQNLVFGGSTVTKDTCENMRYGGACGFEGLLFEPRWRPDSK